MHLPLHIQGKRQITETESTKICVKQYLGAYASFLSSALIQTICSCQLCQLKNIKFHVAPTLIRLSHITIAVNMFLVFFDIIISYMIVICLL